MERHHRHHSLSRAVGAALLLLAAGAAAAGAQTINTCTRADAVPWFETPEGERVITVGAANAYLPRCVVITEGQSVTFQMNFSVHPLEGGLHKGGDPQPGNPIPTVTSGSAPVAVVFPEAGAWGFFCSFHQPPMAGAVCVVAPPFADGFETGDACAWSATSEPTC